MNIFKAITRRIVARLEADDIPWQRPWTFGLPRHLTTGKEFRGVNLLLLDNMAFRSCFWLTAREAAKLGGKVRPGQRPTPVVYWRHRSQRTLEHLRRKSGGRKPARCAPVLRAMFNLDQVEGVPRPPEDVLPAIRNAPANAARLLRAKPNKPGIRHAPVPCALYRLPYDEITMPHPSQFPTDHGYFRALFHAMIHATGTIGRLGRHYYRRAELTDLFGFEQLVAELGTDFLCGAVHLCSRDTTGDLEGHATEWAQVLRRDPRLIVTAADFAQTAAEYMRGMTTYWAEGDPPDGLIRPEAKG